MFREHDVVTVTVDVPQQGVARGDVGAIVHCYPGRDVYEVDVLNEGGRSKVIATLLGSQLLTLNLVSLVA